jgi:hypothetical protein
MQRAVNILAKILTALSIEKSGILKRF